MEPNLEERKAPLLSTENVDNFDEGDEPLRNQGGDAVTFRGEESAAGHQREMEIDDFPQGEIQQM